MSFESMTGDSAGGVSPVTTPNIVYDDILIRDSSSTEDVLNIRLPKRGISLPQIVLASSLIALTTPLIALPNLRLSGPTCLQISDQTDYVGIEKSRNITLRQAREIALRAHYQFEEGLRRDRIQEARLVELAVNENEA